VVQQEAGEDGIVDSGNPMPEPLKESVRRVLANRGEADAENRKSAEIILEMLGG